jgi:hypothetical protein
VVEHSESVKPPSPDTQRAVLRTFILDTLFALAKINGCCVSLMLRSGDFNCAKDMMDPKAVYVTK